MSVGVQIGPKCTPGCVPVCGAEALATAGLRPGAAVDGSSGSTIQASGDSEGSFQSGWHQLIEALGLRSGEEPAAGKEAGAVSAPSIVKPASSQALRFSPPASATKHKAGETNGMPPETAASRTNFPLGKKAVGAGSAAPAQAHEGRKREGLTATSADAGVEPASGSGFQLIAVRIPDIAVSRAALPPTGTSVPRETFASDSRGERNGGGLSTPAAGREAMAKGSMTGPANDGMGSVSGNGSADANGGGLLNGKNAAAASGEEHKLDRTEAAGNPGWQEPGQGLNESLQVDRPAHATTERAIANEATARSTDSQFAAANATPPAEHRSVLRSGRAVEPSLVRGAERLARNRMGGESAGERGISSIAAQDAAGPMLVRDPAGITAASGRQGGWVDTARAAGNEMSGMTGEETFARLDAGGASQSIHWVQAGAHRAEAGYLDPALGWVGVRAETSGGGVHAAVLPGSVEAAQVLSTHLGGLSAFLSQQHGPHATATIAAPQDGGYGAGAEQGNSAGGGSGRDDGAEKNMTQAGRESDSSLRTIASVAAGAVDTSMGSDGSVLRRAGTYVSVMA